MIPIGKFGPISYGIMFLRVTGFGVGFGFGIWVGYTLGECECKVSMVCAMSMLGDYALYKVFSMGVILTSGRFCSVTVCYQRVLPPTGFAITGFFRASMLHLRRVLPGVYVASPMGSQIIC